MVLDPTDLPALKKVLTWLINAIPKIPVRIIFGTGGLRISPFAGGGWPHWSYGRDERGLIAFLALKFYVRNTVKKPLFLTTGRADVLFVRWWKPFSRSKLVPPLLSPPNNPFVGLASSSINPDETKVVSLLATVRPAPRKNRSLLVRASLNSDLGLAGSRWFWLRGTGDPPKIRKREKPPLEELTRREQQRRVALAELEGASPGTARRLDSLLRAEADVYRSVGRQAGGLGTISLTYQGRTFSGMGTEWRTPGLPTQQFVVEDPENASVRSENWDAIKKLFKGLPDDGVRERAARYLACQLDGESEYASVGYFIVGVLWLLGYLSHALPGLRCLRGTMSEYSLGEALRLLAGLLRYKHNLFRPEELDVLEEAIAVLDCEEGLFEIPERIRAVRAFRLRESG